MRRTYTDLPPEKQQLLQLALGRIFRLGSRATQPGDVEEYERCRALILDTLDDNTPPGYRPSYARDRLLGASGD